MYNDFTLILKSDFSGDYDVLFCKSIGDNFAKTMETCFYSNQIREDKNVYYQLLPDLNGILTLPQYLAAVFFTFNQADAEYAISKLGNMFAVTDGDKRYPINYAKVEASDGQYRFIYKNIETEVSQAIIFGAYFLAGIYSEIWKDKQATKDRLYSFLIKFSGLNKEAFVKHHPAVKFYKIYFMATMKSVCASMQEESQGNNKRVKDLAYYRDHPEYGLGYGSVISYLGIVSMKDGVELSDEAYINVFAEAETCVERVLRSKNPEIEISRVHAYLSNKYKNYEQKNSGVTFSVITSEYRIGCIIELLFLIVVYDKLPEKNERTMQALINCRAFLENHDNSYIYLNDSMWKLVAQRIPALPSRPRVEDLLVEIDSLKSQLESYATGKCSTRWNELVEEFVKPFDDVMKPTGFYELPRVKQLSRLSQCKLIMKILEVPIPFKVAILHTIGFLTHLSTVSIYPTKTSRLQVIERALKLKTDNRELKGNINVLNSDSKEDNAKYTANKSLTEAESFLERL